MTSQRPQPMRPSGRLARMRRLALLGAGLLFASALATLPVNTVLACSCVALTDNQAMAAADVAFIGVVVRADDPAAGNPVISSGDPIHYTVVVERPLKGDLGAGQEVVVGSARDGASCGEVLAVGERWRLLVHSRGAGFTTGLCSGSQLLASGVAMPERPSSGDTTRMTITPLLMILGAGAMSLLALLVAILSLRWGGRPTI